MSRIDRPPKPVAAPLPPEAKAMTDGQLAILKAMAEAKGLHQLVDAIDDELKWRNPRMVRVQGRDGIIQWVECDPITVDAKPPAPESPRTTTKPSHLTWREMDRKTSYRTGCAFNLCPQCGGTELRRRYDTGQEQCWECSYRVPMKAAKPKLDPKPRIDAREIVKQMAERLNR